MPIIPTIQVGREKQHLGVKLRKKKEMFFYLLLKELWIEKGNGE